MRKDKEKKFRSDRWRRW